MNNEWIIKVYKTNSMETKLRPIISLSVNSIIEIQVFSQLT